MSTTEIERIRKINATKAHGHIDSAVSHCAYLLECVDLLHEQNLDLLEALQILKDRWASGKASVRDWKKIDSAITGQKDWIKK